MNFTIPVAMTQLLESLDGTADKWRPETHRIWTTSGGCVLRRYDDPQDEQPHVNAMTSEDAFNLFAIGRAVDDLEHHEPVFGGAVTRYRKPDPAWHQEPQWDRFPSYEAGSQPFPLRISERDDLLYLLQRHYRLLEKEVRDYYENKEEADPTDLLHAAACVSDMYKIRMYQLRLKELAAKFREWRTADDEAEANELTRQFRKGEFH